MDSRPASSEPLALHRVCWQSAGLVVLLSGLFFGLTLEPGLYWGDSAWFASHLDTAPKPFARSYWMYKALGRALVGLGVPPTAAATMATATYASLAVGLLFAVVQRLCGRRAPALVGAAALTVAHTFWLYATVAEVYSLLLLMELGLFFLCLGAGRSGREAVGLGLLLGLALNHHRLLWFGFPIFVIGAIIGTPAVARRQRVGEITLGLTIGLVPWLGLCALYPPSWLPPVEGESAWSLWWKRALLGGVWSAKHLGPLEALRGSLGSAWLGGKLVLLNFASPALLLAALGLSRLRREPVLGLLIGGLLLVFGAAASLFSWTGDQHAFFTPLLPLVAILGGLGLHVIRQHLGPIALPTVLALTLMTPPALYAFASIGLGSLGSSPGQRLERQEFLWPAKRGYNLPERWGASVLEQLPQGAQLVSQWSEGAVLYSLRAQGLYQSVELKLHRSGPLPKAADGQRQFLSWKPTLTIGQAWPQLSDEEIIELGPGLAERRIP